MIDSEELERLASSFGSLAVGVVGDFCLDIYWELDDTISEVSLETGIPAAAVRTERMAPGGAGNVALNLKGLGVGTVLAFGAVGEDPYAAELLRQLRVAGVDSHGVRSVAGRHTHLFVKPYVDGVEERRIDVGNYNALADADAAAILGEIRDAVRGLDALVVNQQFIPAASIHTPLFRAGLAALLAEGECAIVLVDSRDHANDFPGAIRKMNDREAMRYSRATASAQLSGDEQYDVADAARRLARAWKTPVVVTRGEREVIVVRDPDLEPDLVPTVTPRDGVRDTVGAGDSFVAGLCAASAAGSDLVQGATFAALCAGVTVSRAGQTGVATTPDVLRLNRDGSWNWNTRLADAPESAVHRDGTQIEIVVDPPPVGQIGHAVFDHDGTVSTLREGWESIMEPMMIEAIVGTRPDGLSDAMLERIRARVHDFIESTTGVQTLVQMKGLADLVREYAIVDPSGLLDEHGYKAIFNERLLERVNGRLDRLSAGSLSTDDFVVKGALRFIEELARRGVRLYLASGTDEEDVRREADLLGYARLFDGGIFGARGSLTAEAKRDTLVRIIDDAGESGGAIAVFGDGPVEIREARRAGALAVGVASDERRRSGLDLAKRRRLIRAGAHAVVPDFSETDALIGWLEASGFLLPGPAGEGGPTR